MKWNKNKINPVCPTCGLKKPVNRKSVWKTERFKMYKKIKKKLDFENDEKIRNKLEFKKVSIINAVKVLCNSNMYKKHYLNFYDECTFNVDKEIKNLYHLLGDPRQRKVFNEVE